MTIYKESVVAYVDILGFKEAIIENLEPELLQKFVALLKEYENPLSQVSIVEEKNNVSRLDLKPVITAFSDCMVLSFSDKDQIDPKISWYNLILNIIGILQDFTYKMLYHGFLVRGAITSGKLFHERGVVLGPALIEAYELESKKAITPRIIVTDEITRKFNDGSGSFLDEKKYFSICQSQCYRHLDLSGIWEISRRVDIQHITNIVTRKIEEIKKNAVFSCKDYGHTNKVLSKWIWFKDNIIDNIQASMGADKFEQEREKFLTSIENKI